MYYSLKKISVHYIISRNKPLVLTSGFHGMTDLMSAPLMMAVNFRIPSMIATVYFPQRNVSAIVVLAKAPSWSFHHVFKAVLTDNPAEWNTWDWQALNKLNLSVPLPHHNSWWSSVAVSWCRLTYDATVLKDFSPHTFWHVCTHVPAGSFSNRLAHESFLHCCLQIRRTTVRHDL